jgi:hypothetical protein
VIRVGMIVLLTAYRVLDALLLKRAFLSWVEILRYRFRPLLHNIFDCRGDFLPARVRETHIQHAIPLIPTGHFHRPVHGFQNIRFYQFSLAQNPYPGAIAV